MKSRLATNLVLLAIVAILGYIIFNTDSDDVESPLSDFDITSADSIEIQHRDRYVVLKKTGQKWRITRPLEIAANEFRINNLLKLLHGTSQAQYPVADIQLSRFKLDTPRTSIRLSNGRDAIKLDFGTSNPINRLRYVRNGDTVHLVQDHLYPLISSQLGTLISPRLFPEDIEILSLKIPGYKLNRAGIEWQLQPEIEGFSSDNIQQLLDNWQHAEAFGVHDYMERKQLGKVELGYRSGNITLSDNLVITDTDPWLIIARPAMGIEYHFDISHYDSLLNPASKPDKAILDAEQAIVNDR